MISLRFEGGGLAAPVPCHYASESEVVLNQEPPLQKQIALRVVSTTIALRPPREVMDATGAPLIAGTYMTESALFVEAHAVAGRS